MFEIDPMEVIYQRRCSQTQFCAPDGLRELMTDISREVLRYQPTQIYSFIADYLDSLMITRENARVAMKFVEEITESGQVIAELLEGTNLTHEQANKMARIIQRAFKRHMMSKQRETPLEEKPLFEKIMIRTNITYQDINEAAIIIQRTYKRHRMRKLAEEERGGLDWRAAARNTIAIFCKLRTTNLEKEKAATRIKAAYKGYYMRKMLRKMCEEADAVESRIKEQSVQQLRVETNAALVIQRAYRSHLILKDLTEQEEAATKIQRVFRMHLREKELAEQTQAATVIQKKFRMFKKAKTEDDTKAESQEDTEAKTQEDEVVKTEEVQEVEEVKTQEVPEVKTKEDEAVKSQQVEDVKTQEVPEVKTKEDEAVKSQQVEDVKTQEVPEVKTKEDEAVKSQQVEDVKTQEVEKVKTEVGEEVKTQDDDETKAA